MKKILAIILIVSILFTLFVYVIYENNKRISISNITIENDKLPSSFNNYKIMHISDFHNRLFPDNQKQLFESMKSQKTDIIVITGDILDRYETVPSVSLEFIDYCLEIAPVYYVSGNHEEAISGYPEFKKQIIKKGVHVLDNKSINLQGKNDEFIQIIGLDDPRFSSYYDFENNLKNLSMIHDEQTFKVLLSHRPEFFEMYSHYDIDLTLSGHAHGGQFVLPNGQGIFAPHQGFFPEYDAGLIEDNNHFMYVSRGIGNSIFPFRVNNPPEIIFITLISSNVND